MCPQVLLSYCYEIVWVLNDFSFPLHILLEKITSNVLILFETYFRYKRKNNKAYPNFYKKVHRREGFYVTC